MPRNKLLPLLLLLMLPILAACSDQRAALEFGSPQHSLTLIRGDVFRYLYSASAQGFDFIFADPPYALKELPEVPELVFKRDLLRDGGIFVMEHPKTNDFSGLPYFYQHRVYGSVNFSIFIKEEEKTDA